MGLKHKAEEILRRFFSSTSKDKEGSFKNFEESFLSFLQILEVEKAGFMMLTSDDHYTLHFTIGLDVTSMHRFNIPKETIQHYLPIDTVSELSSNELAIFKPYFSSREYNSFNKIFIYPITFKDKKFFLLLINSMLDKTRKEFLQEELEPALKTYADKIKDFFHIIKITTPITYFQKENPLLLKKIDTALQNHNSANCMTLSLDSIFTNSIQLHENISTLQHYYAIINQLLTAVGKTNIAILENSTTLHIILFSKLPVDPMMYYTQITLSISKIFGDTISKKLVIQSTKTEYTKNKILEFLNMPQSNPRNG